MEGWENVCSSKDLSVMRRWMEGRGGYDRSHYQQLKQAIFITVGGFRMRPGSVSAHFLRETAVEMLQNKGGKGIIW